MGCRIKQVFVLDRNSVVVYRWLEGLGREFCDYSGSKSFGYHHTCPIMNTATYYWAGKDYEKAYEQVVIPPKNWVFVSWY